DDQRTLRKFLALGDDGPGTDNAVAADPRAVHHDRAHTDERAILQRAAVQNDVMADGAVLADNKRKAEIGGTGRTILNIGALADLDPFIVAAQHRAEPDAGAGLQAYATDHARCFGDEIIAVGRKIGRLPVKLVDRHQGLLSARPWHSGIAISRQRGFAKRWQPRRCQASTPAARSVIRKKVPLIMLQKPAMMVAIITNSKRRLSSRAPRSVLRMMIKGAANTRNGTAAKVFGATPSPRSPKPA